MANLSDSITPESHLRDFAEWNPNPIIEINLQGKIIYFNLAARAQFPTLSRMGTAHPILLGLMAQIDNLVQSKGEFVVFLREIKHSNFIFEQQIFSVSKNNSIFIYMNDITAAKHAEEQLRINLELEEQNKLMQEASRLKSEFLSNMSHELRTPLNAIIGFSELIYDENLGPVTSGQKEALNDVLISAKNLLGMIKDLLDFTHFEFGKIELNPQEINLTKLVNEVTDTFSILMLKKHIQLTVSVDNSIVNVYLDPMRLEQVLHNYLSNAIKFIPEQGTIQIRVLPETGANFRLEVEDDGGGIKPEDCKKLFTAFQQLDSSSTKKYAGTGLGLSLTKHIVEAQGGTVGAICTADKNIFYAVLPRQYPPKT